MSANGGDVVVQLTLDDKQYTVAVKNAGGLMREFKRSIDGTASSVKRLEEQQLSLGRRFRDLVLTLGNLRFVAMDINDIFLRLPMAILRSAGELERLQQLMTGLSKETEAFKRQAEGLRDFNFVVGMAKNAPFEISALSNTFVKLKTAGIDPAAGSMQALVDSVARFGGTGDTLNRAAVAIQQMAGKGVISMEELRQQLGEAVPTAMRSMADGMNMSMAELAKLVSTGTLVAGPALEKMFLRMRIENAGAAAEMMATWVGMTARLKTEWDLTAKYIADNGFGDAAKAVVRDLTNVLQSDEFRNFGADFGKGLGEVVRDLLSITKTIIAYREEIVLLGKAWLAYKVIFSGIVPLAKALEANFNSVRNTAQGALGQIRATAAATQANTLRAIENSRLEAKAAMTRAADVITAKRLETEITRQENARILAEHNRLQAALRAAEARGRGGVTMPGVQGALARDEVRRRVQDLGMAYDANSASIRANAAEIARHEALMRTSSAQMAAATAQANSFSAGARAMALAQGAATVANRAMQATMAALGGPVGVGILLISSLAAAWFNLKRAAEEAQQAQIDAMNGVANAKQLESLEKQTEESAKRLAAARKRLSESTVEVEGSAGGMLGLRRKKTEAELEADRREYAQAAEEDRKIWTAREKARVTVTENGAEQRATNRTREIDRELRDLDSAGQQRMRVLMKEAKDKLSQFKDGSKEYLAAQKIENERQAKALIESENQKKALLDKAIAEASARSDASRVGSAERIEADKLLAELQQRRGQIEASVKQINGALTNPVEINKDAGKGKKKPNPLGDLIETLRAQKAELGAELKGFDDTAKKGDAVAGVIARMMQQYTDGKFDVKGVRPPLAEFNKALQLAVDAENLKGEIKSATEAAKDLEKFADYFKGLSAELADMQDAFTDPLGLSGKGRSVKSAEKWMRENGEAIRAEAEKTGKSIEEVRKGVMNRATAIDAAQSYSNLVNETKTLNDSLVADSRDAARARAVADNERHRRLVENLIEERRLAGEAPEKIEQMRQALEANMAARAATVEQQFKSPFQKLKEEWSNTTKAMEEASVGWLDSTADAITELVMTGKADFAGLAKSIIADLIKIQVRKAMVSAISAATSWFADGGVMTSSGSMPLKEYAAGGIANSPQMAIFGEGDMPEAYVPLPDGRTIPVTLSNSGNSGAAGAGVENNVQISITVHQDGSAEANAQGSSASDFRRMAERVKGVVREELMAQQRPGGMLAS